MARREITPTKCFSVRKDTFLRRKGTPSLWEFVIEKQKEGVFESWLASRMGRQGGGGKDQQSRWHHFMTYSIVEKNLFKDLELQNKNALFFTVLMNIED